MRTPPAAAGEQRPLRLGQRRAGVGLCCRGGRPTGWPVRRARCDRGQRCPGSGQVPPATPERGRRPARRRPGWRQAAGAVSVLDHLDVRGKLGHRHRAQEVHGELRRQPSRRGGRLEHAGEQRGHRAAMLAVGRPRPLGEPRRQVTAARGRVRYRLSSIRTVCLRACLEPVAVRLAGAAAGAACPGAGRRR